MDQALEAIEAAVLPGAAMLLDTLLDSAVLALPGVDAAAYADELRSLAGQLTSATRGIEALAPAQERARLRMSA